VSASPATEPHPIAIPLDGVRLLGELAVPDGAAGIVAFAHGTGSGRHSPRNRFVAQRLNQAGLATLLLDLLTEDEEAEDLRTRKLRFDITLLADRFTTALDWLALQDATRPLQVGCFGASTGAAAALIAAARRPNWVRSVVSRGGRPDLAAQALPSVTAPTLLIVGGNDPVVLDLNRQARAELRSESRLEIVRGATHLFEEHGALEAVADLARAWFTEHLSRRSAESSAPEDRGPGQSRHAR
jgi:putative phosphoribosyl transferase